MADPRYSRVAFARLAFALAAFVSFSAEARAADKPLFDDQCSVTLARAIAIGKGVVAENPDAEFIEYTGDEAKKLVDAINAVPPVSAWDADAIIVIDPKEEPFRVGLAVEGCVTRAFQVPREIWPSLVRGALGDRS